MIFGKKYLAIFFSGLLIISCSPYIPNPNHDKDAGNLVAGGLVNLYQQEISPIDGPRSGSYPTGTSFAKSAYRSYGFFLGTIITANRLLHEIDDNNVVYTNISGKKMKLDPLDNNVYWWDEKVKEKYVTNVN